MRTSSIVNSTGRYRYRRCFWSRCCWQFVIVPRHACGGRRAEEAERLGAHGDADRGYPDGDADDGDGDGDADHGYPDGDADRGVVDGRSRADGSSVSSPAADRACVSRRRRGAIPLTLGVSRLLEPRPRTRPRAWPPRPRQRSSPRRVVASRVAASRPSGRGLRHAQAALESVVRRRTSSASASKVSSTFSLSPSRSPSYATDSGGAAASGDDGATPHRATTPRPARFRLSRASKT